MPNFVYMITCIVLAINYFVEDTESTKVTPMPTQTIEQHKIPVGISECLLGKAVRYNGGHKHSKLCSKDLSRHFSFVATCPEMAIGLGVPRKPIRLVTIDNEVRVRGSEDSNLDVTNELKEEGLSFATNHPHLCGFIFTQNSPSCGLYGVKVYHENGNPLSKDRGAFAKTLTEKLPCLPVEEAGRLNDPLLRETFVTAVFAYHDWQSSVAANANKKALIDFHTRNKFLLLAHSTQTYRNLGQLISDLKNNDLETIKHSYLQHFMKALKTPTTRGRHCNVLEHIQGYLRDSLTSSEKASINKSIHDYRKGYVPLVVPMTLLNHYATARPEAPLYIQQQSYLNAAPIEMGLRNEI